MNAFMFGHGIEVAEGYFILLEPSIKGTMPHGMLLRI